MWVPKLQMRIDDSFKTLYEFPLPGECSQFSSSSTINAKDAHVNQSSLCAHACVFAAQDVVNLEGLRGNLELVVGSKVLQEDFDRCCLLSSGI